MDAYRMTLDFGECQRQNLHLIFYWRSSYLSEKDKLIAQLREENSHYRLLVGSVEDAKRLFQEQCNGAPPLFPSYNGGQYQYANPSARRGTYYNNRGGNNSRGGRGASSSSGADSGPGPYRRRGKTDYKKSKDNRDNQSKDNRENQREDASGAKKTTAREHNEELMKRITAQEAEISRLREITNNDES